MALEVDEPAAILGWLPPPPGVAAPSSLGGDQPVPEPTVPDPGQRCAEFAPVIEQAKGIIMAQYRCGPDEAFEILRGMSQHANVKLRVLAERMVQQVSLPSIR